MTIPNPTPITGVSPLSAGDITVQITDGIATLSFFHPKGNSLPGPLLRKLAEAVTEIGERGDATVIVLRSAGSGPFCAGASFDELVAIQDAAGGHEFFMGFARLVLAMIRCPKFIVTRAHGKVVGGGIGIVAASDYVIGHDSASLRLSELAVGIGPFIVGLPIERKIGLAAFQQMAVDADWRTPQWGERVGLYVDVATNHAELDAKVDAMAAKLAKANPEAMSELKRVFWRGTEDWDRLLDERARISGRLVTSEFTRNAIAAFASR